MQYKWIALSNTTIGTLMAGLDGTIVLISLPAIFNGIKVNPLTSFEYLLWILFGYSIVTSTLLVTFGRISDMFGRVRLYNLGFAIFTVGSTLCYLTPSTGDAGVSRAHFLQNRSRGGAAFLFSNSAAIITDAFPENERGQALGINMVAVLAGSLIGLVGGGILASIDWRYIFLVSVPVGIFGTVWSYWKLKEVGTIRRNQRLDIWGNVTFGVGLTLLLVGITYGLLPYQSSSMGWGNPWVIASLLSGSALLIAFPFVEMKVQDPMFNLGLFKIRAFGVGSFAGLLAAIGRGGVQIMLIILLQGIWLPLHGYAITSTPFWSGIYLTPMLAGFVVMGPISGRLSDRHGARLLATAGMVITAGAFLALSLLPYNFAILPFAIILFMMGLGGGMFASPNTASIMNAPPREYRGAASGMRATLQNVGMTMSIAIFFTIILAALSTSLPGSISTSLIQQGVSSQVANQFGTSISPTGALFAAFLGYNPIASGLSSQLLSSIPAAALHAIEAPAFFATAIAPAFTSALRLAFYIGAALSIVAAVASALRGKHAPRNIPTQEVDMGQQKPVPAFVGGSQAKPNEETSNSKSEEA